MARIEGPPGAARLVGTAFVLVMLAILMARLLLAGGWAWGLFALLLPIVLVVLGLLLGWVPALLGAVFFAAAVLLFRTLVGGPGGWILLVLTPVVGLSLLIASKVWRAMRAAREPDTAAAADGPRE